MCDGSSPGQCPVPGRPQAVVKHIWNKHMSPKQPLGFSFSCRVRTLNQAVCSVLCKAALGCSLEATQAASMPLVFPVSATVTITIEVVRFSSPHLHWLIWDPSGGPVFTSGELKPPLPTRCFLLQDLLCGTGAVAWFPLPLGNIAISCWIH